MASENWSNLDGVRVTKAEVFVPTVGAWVADVLLAEDTAVSLTPVLTLGDLVFKGAVVREAAFAGVRNLRLVGGAGGWRVPVDPYPYAIDTGIPILLVVSDAASAVGESVDCGDPARLIGTNYLRQNAPASRVLHDLASTWYVDPSTGVTKVDRAWPSDLITSDFQVIGRSGAEGRVVVSTETASDWLPGRTFTAPTITTAKTITAVTHTVGNDGVHRVSVLTSGSLVDRWFKPFREMVAQETARLTYLARWEYVVQSVDENAGTVGAVPTVNALALAAAPLPEHDRIPMAAGMLGERVVPQVGSICTVTFTNGDPTRPTVVGGDTSNAPTLAAIGGGALGSAPGIARVGDAVQLHALFFHVPPSGPDLIILGHVDGLGHLVPAYAFTATGLAAFDVSLLPAIVVSGTDLGAVILSGSTKVECG